MSKKLVDNAVAWAVIGALAAALIYATWRPASAVQPAARHVALNPPAEVDAGRLADALK